MAISEVCTKVGFNFKDMLATVRLYATRNELVHSNLASLIKNGQFDDLKGRLYNDYCDVTRIFSANEGSEAHLVSNLIEGMIDRWYIRNPKNPNNIQMWRPTSELQDCWLKLQDEKEGDAYKKMLQKITFRVAMRVKSEEEPDWLKRGLETNFGIRHGKQKVKYVSSAQFDEEVKRAKLMKKD